MSWRGEFVTVFDLGTVLGLGLHDGAPGYAVILRRDAPRAALSVERAERVARIDSAGMRSADGWQGGIELLRGVTADGIAVLHDQNLTARLTGELKDA
jgi:chemotaxis signal transduction protein